MKNGNVVEMPAGATSQPKFNQPQRLLPPKHFKGAQRAAWEDLTGSVEADLLVRMNRFEFEMAAVLLAKFRSGKPMNATETKELKRQLVSFGLSKDEDGGGRKKPKKNARYFEPAAD